MSKRRGSSPKPGKSVELSKSHGWRRMATMSLLTRVSTVSSAQKSNLKTETDSIVVMFRAGVAYHHAGLSSEDRQAIEHAYLSGQLSIICCTSTLAVGVNLPCYLVIIKGTVSYSGGLTHEYPDLEIMQMLGRAGRPQFETSAMAVILTRNEQVGYYQKLVSGQEKLESCLHKHLIDHLNAEIGLGTITDIISAKKWLAGTFLYVRLKKNPSHYKFKEDVQTEDVDSCLEQICAKDVKLLQENHIITVSDILRCTGYGEAMARYYVRFETMQTFMSLPPKAKMSEMVSPSS